MTKYKVDEKDISLVTQYTWWRKPNGYIYTQIGGALKKTLYMHRLVMDAKKGQEVDHINRDPSDNRRSNLRFATRSQQNMNKNGVRGIDRFKNKWRARIKINRKEIHLGIFNTYEEAVEVRKQKEKLLFKQFANIRIIQNI